MPLSMNVYFGSRELNSQLPTSVRKGLALSALLIGLSVRNSCDIVGLLPGVKKASNKKTPKKV